MIALTRVGFVAGLITFVLSGCGYFEDDEEILPGERIPVRAVAGENMTPPDIASQISAISRSRTPNGPRSTPARPMRSAMSPDPPRFPSHGAPISATVESG